MTNPKPRTAAAGSGTRVTANTPGADNSDDLLRQLIKLTESVEKLANRPAGRAVPPPAPTPTPTPTPPPGPPEREPAENERLTMLFAYNFLGEVVGRRNFRFTLRAVADRDRDGLRFTELRGGTFARLRSADNRIEELENLVAGTRVKLTVIPDDQAIDAIVVLERRGGVPVAIGNCQGPVPGVIID
ncbi:hypothetical protein [Actinoplanes sp. NPDC051411]|uniref:hypothetical protein n=1 Tax=Actinoplanes sp. NPDC051411 TaxID=3155522 RepID=UPI003446A9DC